MFTTSRPLFHTPFTRLTSHTRRPPLSRRNSRITMSTTTDSTTSTIEHIVLFKVKPSADPTQLTTMVNGLSSLSTLPMVLHLTAGNLHNNRSSSTLSFTHLLHSRYRTKDDLANYSSHPDHLSVVRSSVLPICDDIMAIDWVSDTLTGQTKVNPNSAMRLQLIKLKDGVTETEKKEVVDVISGMKEKLGGGILGFSFGENFSPARAKGFEICSIAVFDGVKELEELEGSNEIEKEKDKVRGLIDDLVVVDYVVPNPNHSASL